MYLSLSLSFVCILLSLFVLIPTFAPLLIFDFIPLLISVLVLIPFFAVLVLITILVSILICDLAPLLIFVHLNLVSVSVTHVADLEGRSYQKDAHAGQ